MKLSAEKIEASHKGYYPFVEQGLIVEMSSAQKHAYNSGEGGELKWKVVPHYSKAGKGKQYVQLVPPKMCSKTSSSALVVNSFAEAAKLNSCDCDYWNQLLFKGEPFFHGKIKEACFEKKLKIDGIQGYAPNVDFYLRTSDRVVAIESKYTETTKYKKATIQDQYLQLIESHKWNVPALDAIREVIKNRNEYHYLDVAQLIKHMLGLVSLLDNGRLKINQCKLIYLYHPIADKNKDHQSEVKSFLEAFDTANAKSWIKAMTYKELFSNLKEIPGTQSQIHYEKLRKRYHEEIDAVLWDD